VNEERRVHVWPKSRVDHVYYLAWCDGPPFAYDYGLRTARAHLQALSAPEPEMPPYDPSNHEPIEEIDIALDGDREIEREEPPQK
jgi:hypothetical protein